MFEFEEVTAKKAAILVYDRLMPTYLTQFSKYYKSHKY